MPLRATDGDRVTAPPPRSLGARGATRGAQLAALRSRTRRTRVNWQASDDLTVEEWEAAGPALGIQSRASGWWLGDWVRFGTRHYGLSIADAAVITGYEEQTLYNMVSIAAKFPVSRRREGLSWSHHADVAALRQTDQDAWLDRAVREHLSVQELRKCLQRARRTERTGAPPRPGGRTESTPPSDPVRVTCPHCARALELDRSELLGAIQ